MILSSAVRGLALIGSLVLPDVGRPVAAAGPVDLFDVLAGGGAHDFAQQPTAFGGDISGVHALQGAVQKQIDFRPRDEEGEWDVFLWFNDAGWVHVGEAWTNIYGDVGVEGDNGTGTGYFTCKAGGGWDWTVYSFGEKIGSGTMS